MNVTEAIKNLCIFHDIFPFSEFTDKGNACYKPFRDDDPTVVNHLVSEVLTAMPKYGELHKRLSACVAGDLNIKWVTYDNLVKITARILAGIDSEDEIRGLAEIAFNYRCAVKYCPDNIRVTSKNLV